MIVSLGAVVLGCVRVRFGLIMITGAVVVRRLAMVVRRRFVMCRRIMMMLARRVIVRSHLYFLSFKTASLGPANPAISAKSGKAHNAQRRKTSLHGVSRKRRIANTAFRRVEHGGIAAKLANYGVGAPVFGASAGLADAAGRDLAVGRGAGAILTCAP